MWVVLICGLFLYHIVKRIFCDDEAHVSHIDLDSSHFNSVFAVAKRLEKLYKGSKVYTGLQIPDADSASRKNVDIVLVTNQEAVVISVRNVEGFCSIDKDNNWVCTDRKCNKTERLVNPVVETRELVSTLEEYLEQRGVALPGGYLSYKIIYPNQKFSVSQSDSFPPEVMTYNQWTQLKPELPSFYSGWIKGSLLGGKKKTQESFSEKINSVLSTAPVLDRLDLKDNKCILGQFLEFKGKQDDLQLLRKIKRSKVSHLTVQYVGLFSFESKVLFTRRDYRVEGPSLSSQCEEAKVASSTEVVFQPHDSTKSRNYKLYLVASMSLSA